MLCRAGSGFSSRAASTVVERYSETSAATSVAGAFRRLGHNDGPHLGMDSGSRAGRSRKDSPMGRGSLYCWGGTVAGWAVGVDWIGPAFVRSAPLKRRRPHDCS